MVAPSSCRSHMTLHLLSRPATPPAAAPAPAPSVRARSCDICCAMSSSLDFTSERRPRASRSYTEATAPGQRGCDVSPRMPASMPPHAARVASLNMKRKDESW